MRKLGTLRVKSTGEQKLRCPYCGQTKCNCLKLAGAYYIVMALTIAAFALSLFSIVTTAWIVAVLVALKGVMYLSQAKL